MSAHNPSFRYTVIAINVHGTPGKPEQLFAAAGAVYAERTCSVVCTGQNSTGYLVATPNPFGLVRHFQNEGWLVGDADVKYHGLLADYFTNPRTEELMIRRAKVAERRCAEWREAHDPFYMKGD